jgi:drug/metabolite transporter (DMT)-like permease
MNLGMPYIGEALSLLTAVAWSIAVILFKKSGESVHPIALNIFKNLLGILLFLPTLYFLGETLYRPVPVSDYLILFLSGAIGLGIGDTLFLKALNLLGAGLMAIVDCLYSPFVIVLSIVFLGDKLSFWQFVGVFLIVSAIFAATYEKSEQKISRHNLIWGCIWGVLAVAAMSVAIVIVKPLLETSPLIWVTELRLISGVVVLVIALLFHPSKKTIISSFTSGRGWIYTLLGSFFGAYVSMMLWLAGMKYAQASVASALNQTSNILIFVFAAIFLKEPIDFKRTAAIILAFIGAFLVTFC